MTPTQPTGPHLGRNHLEALRKVFTTFALNDQKVYYERSIGRNADAAFQVNFLRAGASLVAGLAAGLSAMIMQMLFTGTGTCTAGETTFCTLMDVLVAVTSLIAVIAPAVGAAFSNLADLYQWDRGAGVYKSALESLGVAESYTPQEGMDDATFRAALIAYVQGTLDVMEGESAQWGQLIRTPEQIEAFIRQATERARQVTGGSGGN